MLEQKVYDDIQHKLEEYNKENWVDTIDRIYKEIGSKYSMSYNDISICLTLIIGKLLHNPLSWTFRRFITGYTKYNPIYSSNFGMDVSHFVKYFMRLNNIDIFTKWANDLIVKELIDECGGATEENIVLIVGMIQRLRCVLDVSDLTDNINSYICDWILERTEEVFLEFIEVDDVEIIYDDLCVCIHQIEGAVINGIFPENGEYNIKDVSMYIRERAETFIDGIQNNVNITTSDTIVVNKWLDKIEQTIIEAFLIVLDAANEKYSGMFYDIKETATFIGIVIHTIWQLY